MVGMIVLIAYLAKVNDSELRVVTILNDGEYFHDTFENTASLSFIQLRDLTLEQARDTTLAMEYYGLLHIPPEEKLETAASNAFLYTKDSPVSYVLDRLESTFQSKLRQQRLQDLGVSTAEFEHIEQDFEIRTQTFEGEKSVKGITEIRAFIGGGFGYLIMMFIIIYGGFVMRSVIEEKTSRIIEVIISSVKPFQLMLGKIIGTSLAGVTQFAIWIFSASLLLVIAMLLMDIDLSALNAGPAMGGMATLPTEPANEMQPYINEMMKIPWMLLIASFIIYFVLGYLIYSSIYAAIGAAVDNETDTQQFIFPIILPLMLAIYVGFFSVFSNPHGPIAVGFSLFPLTSPIVMLMRLPSGIGEGGVPWWQLLTSIFLLIVTFIGIVWLAAKIYRVGILMYGKKPTYRELLKWLKY